MYAYVENEAVNKIDASGLQASGCCGPDVTIPTQTTLNDIEATFKRWTVGQKLNACRSLYFPLSTARGAWFMLELANLGAGQWDFPTPPAVRGGGAAGCDTTVKYGGRCFFAGDVHYLMWGKINNLCYQSFHGTAVIVSPFFDPLWSLDLALYAVDVWKNQMHHDPPEYAQGAKLFTTIGYNGS